ncbi:MAG: oxidoreductase [Myxococcota bacterium]
MAGGPETFFELARRMHAAMKQDDLVGPLFANSPLAHVPHPAMLLCEVFGGPPLWTVTLGDIGRMFGKHANLDLSEDQRVRFRDIATATARELVDDEAAVEAIGRYFEWGTEVAVANSQPSHVPEPEAGVPVWSWD